MRGVPATAAFSAAAPEEKWSRLLRRSWIRVGPGIEVGRNVIRNSQQHVRGDDPEVTAIETGRLRDPVDVVRIDHYPFGAQRCCQTGQTIYVESTEQVGDA